MALQRITATLLLEPVDLGLRLFVRMTFRTTQRLLTMLLQLSCVQKSLLISKHFQVGVMPLHQEVITRKQTITSPAGSALKLRATIASKKTNVRVMEK
jgi:hypothetical protein